MDPPPPLFLATVPGALSWKIPLGNPAEILVENLGGKPWWETFASITFPAMCRTKLSWTPTTEPAPYHRRMAMPSYRSLTHINKIASVYHTQRSISVSIRRHVTSDHKHSYILNNSPHVNNSVLYVSSDYLQTYLASMLAFYGT